MPSELIGVRIPVELLQEIDAIADAGNGNRSQTIIELIRRGLGVEPDQGLAQVLGRLDALEKKLPDLSTLLGMFNSV